MFMFLLENNTNENPLSPYIMPIMLVGMFLYGGKFGLSFFKKEKADSAEISSEVISDAE